MTIVPIGKVNVQLKEDGEQEIYFGKLYEELGRNVREILGRCVEAILDEEIDQLLKRKRHHRRCAEDERVQRRMRCHGCGSSQPRNFRRNGHYRRGVDTKWGHLEFLMPQVECQCGCGVGVEYHLLRTRQRIWNDLEAEFRSECGYGLSLREIKAKKDVLLGRSLGLRTINSRIQAVANSLPLWMQSEISEVPPVIRLDGIWVTLMKASGERRQDKLGRDRAVKVGKRSVILVAQGVWPASGRQEILGWVIANGEDSDGWEDLIFLLRQRGMQIEEVKLIIADGSSGLEALRRRLFPQVPFQRCIFHKLKNLWQALQEPEGLDPGHARTYKLNFIQQAAHIWQAQNETEAWQRLKSFCSKWQETQTKATTCLLSDFDLTLTFYRIQVDAALQGEHWPVETLRTTSQLERENRNIRARFDQAVLFHSVQGLSAYLFLNQTLHQFFRQSQTPGLWPLAIEHQIAVGKLFLN